MCEKLIKELKKGMILSDIKDILKNNFMTKKDIGVEEYLNLDMIKNIKGEYVYEIINNINGKKYIGRTNNPIRRVYEHIHEHTNSEFKQDLYKYGLINFIFKCKNSKNMIQEEIKLIGENKNLYNAQLYSKGLSEYSKIKAENKKKIDNEKKELFKWLKEQTNSDNEFLKSLNDKNYSYKKWNTLSDKQYFILKKMKESGENFKGKEEDIEDIFNRNYLKGMIG